MRTLYVLAALALVLLLLGRIRLGGRVEYGAQGLRVWARLGRLRLQVFPWKGKKKGSQPPKEKEKEKPLPQPAQPQPPDQRLGGALEYAQALLPIVLEAAGRFYQKLQVDKLELELTVGAADPADAALRYGQASGILGALWYPPTQAFHVKDGRAGVKVDFDAGGTTLYALASLSLGLGQIAWLGLYFGCRFLKALLGVRRGQRIKQRQRKAA